ncbi:MAG: mannose-1-phosphate guanylyltransferase [Gemmatimonadaceae bacterium]
MPSNDSPRPAAVDAELPPSGRGEPPEGEREPLAVPEVPLPGGDAVVGTLPGEEPAEERELRADTALWAVVLAGGIGSRFWPLSTPERPKQLLSLVGDRPLIADTVARLAPLVPSERVLVLTSRDIAGPLHEAIPEVPAENMLVEPRPLGTAAALAWGAEEVARRAGPDAVFCTMHADLACGFPEEFRRVLRQAAGVAALDANLVVVGARPTRPETAFGYLLPGAPLDADASGAVEGPSPVVRFVEKPGAILAETLIGEGALWNTGIFVWRASVVREAIRRHTAELWPGLAALQARDYAGFADMIQHVSIDRGLLERSEEVVVLPADFGWDDVGTWAALRRVRDLDDTGNGAFGPVHLVDCASNVVHSEAGTVVAYGVSHILLVSLPGLTFLTTLDRAAELNPLLEKLPREMRHDPLRKKGEG